MTYFIVGLGMMGASYAKGLIERGHRVYGYDHNESVNQKALALGYIDDYGIKYIKDSDVVILTLYPHDNIEFIKNHLHLFLNQSLTDISGVKVLVVDEIEKIIPKGVNYVSHHPMAGSEKSGIDYANPRIFRDANFLIIDDDQGKDIFFLAALADDLLFGKTTVITKELHDKMISFTSQLPHLIAVGLVNSDIYKETKDFTGDSYRDLTRIADINEVLWNELFSANKEILEGDLERFIEAMKDLLEALKNSDHESLLELLKKAKEKRRMY